MEGINTQIVPETIVSSGSGQTLKEFAKKAGRYTLEVTATNMALAYIGGRLFYGNANNSALMTGIFFGAITPLSRAILKPFVKDDVLRKLSQGIVCFGVSAVAFKNFGFANDRWSAVIDPVFIPGATKIILSLLNGTPDVFFGIANLVAPKPSQKVQQQETVSTQETPKAETVVAKSVDVIAEDANAATK